MPTVLSLTDLALVPGQSTSEALEVELVPYRHAGFSYVLPIGETVPARVDVDAMDHGWSLRLRMQPDLHGPCARCLEQAVLAMAIDAREVHDPRADDEQLRSDFVSNEGGGEILHVSEWATTAIGVDFPFKVLCADDCEGLCPQCGTNWNHDDCACVEQTGDPRWSALEGLRDQLAGEADGDADADAEAPDGDGYGEGGSEGGAGDGS